VLFAPWLMVLLAGAAGVVETAIGLHAARIQKPFLMPAHLLYWTPAALLTLILFGLPRLTFLAPAFDTNAFDAVLLLPMGLVVACFWMLGRGYAAPGLDREVLLATVRESSPRTGEDEFLLIGATAAIIVQAPRWSRTLRMRVQPPHATALLWQVATAVNVLLVLGSHNARSAPFVLHTLKGALLIVGAVAAFVILLVGKR
jgi:hypothetical protein